MIAIERDEISVTVGYSLQRLLIGYTATASVLNLLVVIFLFGVGQEGLILSLLNIGLALALIQELPEKYVLSQESIQSRSVRGIKRIELSAVRKIHAEWVPFGTSEIQVTDVNRNGIDVPILPITLKFRHALGKRVKSIRPGLRLDSTTKRELGLSDDRNRRDG